MLGQLEVVPEGQLRRLLASLTKVKEVQGIFSSATEEVYREAVELYGDWEYQASPDNQKKALTMLLFDNHFGEIATVSVKGERTTTYNLSIARSRTDFVFDKALDELNQKRGEIDEVVIVLGGDNLDGDGTTYPGQRFEIEAGFADQMLSFKNALMLNLKKMEKARPDLPVRIYGVPGNHGANKPSRGQLHPVKDNHDTAVFRLLAADIKIWQGEFDCLHNVKTVDFPEEDVYLDFEIKGKTARAQHIFPKNPFTPANLNKILLASIQAGELSFFFTGHWHSPGLFQAGPTTFIRAGCMPGLNGFAVSLGMYGKAEQPLLISDGEQGLRNYIPIGLDHIR